MSRTTYFLGITLAIALALAGCAATPTTQPEPPTTQSLIDNMRHASLPTEQSCAAAGMALVCAGGSFSRASKTSLADATCACADRNDAKLGAWH